MNELSMMGYPGMNPNLAAAAGLNNPNANPNNTNNGSANNNGGPGTPAGALHLNQLMSGLGPPGLSNDNNNNNGNVNQLANSSRQLLEQLAQNNVPNQINNDSNHNTPMLNNNVALQPMNINAGNPLFHPHLEDPALLNNTVWKMQLQLASVSMHSMGQPNVYARQNAMKKYLANQSNNNNNQQQQQQQPQMTEASLSLVDKTQKLLMDFASVDTAIAKDKSKSTNANNGPNGTTTNNLNGNNHTNGDNSMMTGSLQLQWLQVTIVQSQHQLLHK